MLGGAWLSGCSDASGEPVSVSYRVPESLDDLTGEQWLDHPWPSDYRLEDGAPVFRGFYNPRTVGLVESYVEASVGLLDGFSPAAGGYVRFEAPIDPLTLPADPRASMEERSSVYLLDVDPESVDLGRRRPIEVNFREAGGAYLVPNTLRWIPAPGFPLRPHTQYALVVAHNVRSASGGDVLASDDLEQVLGIAPATGARLPLAQAWAPAVETIEAHGTRRGAIRSLTVFTTSDPTKEAQRVADHLRTQVPPPDFLARRTPWTRVSAGAYIEYRSEYGPSPNYQQGTLPFAQPEDGGGFQFEDGEPAVVDYFDARFALTIPRNCEMPASGWPIVLYAHGTGGNFRSFIHNGYAETLARECLAVMGVDQIFHGTRPGTPDTPTEGQVLFFNFQNVHAARTNARQSAIDEVQRARLFTETLAEIPSTIAHTGEAIRFDPDNVLFFGHSQGGLNGPLYLALDDSARGGVLSGSGGLIMITLLEKSKPEPSIAELVANVFLALDPEERGELDVFHPSMMLAQSLVDAVDPINYARNTIWEPRPGFSPKSILMTEGIAADGTGDNLTPPRGTEAHAVAMGLPQLLPGVRPLPQVAYGAAPALAVPAEGVRGNLALGMASGALAQWAPVDDDGHYVVFDIAAARVHVSTFLRELAADRVGLVPPP